MTRSALHYSRHLACYNARVEQFAMPEVKSKSGASLEVHSPDSARRIVQITETPFLIGRGGVAGNHLQLDDRRISRQSAAIVSENGQYLIEDRGQRNGIHVSGRHVTRCVLNEGDVISFGPESSVELIFRAAAADTSIQNMLIRIQSISTGDSSPGGLHQLNVLLEATMLLHSQLPLDSVLGTMLDHAISITNADRGLLLEPDASGALRVRLARRSGGLPLETMGLAPSLTAVRQALEKKSSVITEDLAQADMKLQDAMSIVAQRLRAVVAIPLYAQDRSNSTESLVQSQRGHFLGVVYLDSRRPAAFSTLERQILDALAVEAASILDNARLVEYERRRQRLEQELTIARDIQQALLPGRFEDFPHLEVSGINSPCLAVGGDYFDIFPVSGQRTAFLIADVSGKGLGAALLTTMLQGAFSGMAEGVDPSRIFNQINRFLCGHAEVGRYATLFFGILDSDGNLEFINAGHPAPLVVRHGEIVEPFEDGSFPVGLIAGATYETSRVKLELNDTVVLFSDGITEAMDRDHDLFGLPRLRDSLRGRVDAPLRDLQKSVLESVDNFARGASQADDITLLLIRYRSAAGSAQQERTASTSS
jgi:serine phosphatase RsbU (regulator of sigma subunit)